MGIVDNNKNNNKNVINPIIFQSIIHSSGQSLNWKEKVGDCICIVLVEAFASLIVHNAKYLQQYINQLRTHINIWSPYDLNWILG